MYKNVGLIWIFAEAENNVIKKYLYIYQIIWNKVNKDK